MPAFTAGPVPDVTAVGASSNNHRESHVNLATNVNELRKFATDSDGIRQKLPVRAATTAAGALSSAFAAGKVVDGVTLVAKDRILIKNQATASENGIYTVNAIGAPTRATDADSIVELSGATVAVAEGTVNAGAAFTQVMPKPTVGATALIWLSSVSTVSVTQSEYDGLPSQAKHNGLIYSVTS